MRRVGRQRLKARYSRGAAINKISVLRNIADNLHARREQGIPPGGHHRTGEVDQPHLFAGERRGRFAQCLRLRQRSVQRRGIEFDDIILVAKLNAACKRGCRRLVNIKKLEPAIIADPARSGGRQFASHRRIADLRSMAGRGGRDGGWSRGWNLRVRKQRGQKPAEHGQPNCAAFLYHDKAKRPGKAVTLHI